MSDFTWYDANVFADEDEYDPQDDGCQGHPSTSGPIGNVVFCDGTCRS